MYTSLHHFHIPVMGLGHSVDSPIRVAHFGINSAISIVDDLLLEKIREFYSKKCSFPYKNIPNSAPDARALRVMSYLNMVKEVVDRNFQSLKELPIFCNSEKDTYFQLLPDGSPLKQKYRQLVFVDEKAQKERGIRELTNAMQAGSIDVNIMAKVDAPKYDKNKMLLPAEFSDGSAALRGFAQSNLSSSLILSAGFNPRLYSYLAEFKDFYRDKTGEIKKKLILKVSDFRSALIQGKFLAKKGLEVSEFRIESGLNCGGHAFPSDGHLLPAILKEFKEMRDSLVEEFRPMIKRFYESKGWEYPEVKSEQIKPRVTVQGGIGTHGEMQRLTEEFGMDGAGWGTPFLLVPEATCVDTETRELLEKAGEEEQYLSNVSPFGVPFNNLRNSGSEVYTRQQIVINKPGSKCPKGFLVSNTEFTKKPICTASSEYQLLKLAQINDSDMDPEEKERRKQKVLEKTCLCIDLGAGSLINLGIRKASYGRQSVCPGPNIAWFDRTYTLREMIDHIYGRRESLVPAHRPHVFAKEMEMYVDYTTQLAEDAKTPEAIARWQKIAENLKSGIEYCEQISNSKPYENENLESLKVAVQIQLKRLNALEFPKVI